MYLEKPGPKAYYSHFAALYFSSCLLFQILQFFFLITGYSRAFRKRWFLWLAYVYWITITLSGFICAVCYSFTPKPDVTAIHFLIFFAGLTGVGILFVLPTKHSKRDPGESALQFEGRHLESEENTNNRDTITSLRGPELRRMKPRGRASRLCLSFSRIFNRFLKVVHWAMSVIFIAGAITLASSYHFTNPYVI